LGRRGHVLLLLLLLMMMVVVMMIYLFSGARDALMRPTRKSNILQSPSRCQQNSNSGDARRGARGDRCGR